MRLCPARTLAGYGTTVREVAHEALADALDVVRLLHPFYERPFYKQVRENIGGELS